MWGAASCELRRIATSRAAVSTLAGLTGGGAALAVGLVLLVPHRPSQQSLHQLCALLLALPVAAGAALACDEFRGGQHTTTLLCFPRRTSTLLGRQAVAAGLGLVMAAALGIAEALALHLSLTVAACWTALFWWAFGAAGLFAEAWRRSAPAAGLLLAVLWLGPMVFAPPSTASRLTTVAAVQALEGGAVPHWEALPLLLVTLLLAGAAWWRWRRV